MNIIYIDESSDDLLYVISALIISEASWRTCFMRLKAHRQHLRDRHGIYINKELHATDFVGGRGLICPPPKIITKFQRATLFNKTLTMLTGLPDLRIINAVFPKANSKIAWERVFNRINTNASVAKTHALIICDEGNEGYLTKLLRKLRAHNPVPSRFGTWLDTGDKTKNLTLDLVIEDPVFKRSHESHFIQMADFCSFALLRRENPLASRSKYGLDRSFGILKPVLETRASRFDPEGIIRL